jgi:hypothetical protein
MLRLDQQTNSNAGSLEAPVDSRTGRAEGLSLDQVANALSVPHFIELDEFVSRASCEREDFQSLLAGLQSARLRDVILAMLILRPGAIGIPWMRSKILREISPFSDEVLVQDYALSTLQSEHFKDCDKVVVAAAHILLQVGRALTDVQIEKLAEVASKVGSDNEHVAARGAEYILHQLPPSRALTASCRTLAHDWFLSHRGRSNHWLRILSKYPSPASFDFLREIVTGSVSHERTASPLYQAVRKAHGVHSAAAFAGAVGVAINKCLALAGVLGRIDSVHAFIVSAATLYAVKAAWRAVLRSETNQGRDYERVEALAHLSIMRGCVRGMTGEEAAQLRDQLEGFLDEVCLSSSQRQRVQDAAYVVRGGVFEPSLLWATVGGG